MACDARKIRTDASPEVRHLPGAADAVVAHRMPAKIRHRCRFHCHRPPLEISLPFHHPLLDHFENSFPLGEYQYHFANYSVCLSVVVADDDGDAGGRHQKHPSDDRWQYSLGLQSVAAPSS